MSKVGKTELVALWCCRHERYNLLPAASNTDIVVRGCTCFDADVLVVGFEMPTP